MTMEINLEYNNLPLPREMRVYSDRCYGESIVVNFIVNYETRFCPWETIGFPLD